MSIEQKIEQIDDIYEQIKHTLSSVTNYKSEKGKADNNSFLIKMFELYKESTMRLVNNLNEELNIIKNEMISTLSCINIISDKIDDLIQSNKHRTSKIYSRDDMKKSETIKFKSYDIKIESDYEMFKRKTYEMNEKINNLRDILVNNITKRKIRENFIGKNKNFSRTTNFVPSEIDTKMMADFVPRWLPDTSVKRCRMCDNIFGLFLRKHHCRVCGDIFCSKCCFRHESFAPFYKTKVRICEECFINKKNEV